jgi:hypothetical protein
MRCPQARITLSPHTTTPITPALLCNFSPLSFSVRLRLTYVDLKPFTVADTYYRSGKRFQCIRWISGNFYRTSAISRRETALKPTKGTATFSIAGAVIAFKSVDLNDYL